MKRTKDIAITKRDGSIECFRVTKLQGCLAGVLQGRAYDPRLAGPLARAVALHLQEWCEPAPPTSQYIFRCVCSVLEQTGLRDVADDLQHHRRLRAARRRRTRVIALAGHTPNQGRPWCKDAIVATLENQYGLRHNVARFLAGQIEDQVFALNYRLITRSFVAELVRNEVLAWGLADKQVLLADARVCEHPVGPRSPDSD